MTTACLTSVPAKRWRVFFQGVALAALFFCQPSARATTTNRWEFTNPDDYELSDVQLIEIAEGTARLKRQDLDLYHYSIPDYYTNGATLSYVHAGPDVSIGLTKAGGAYDRLGVYRSRVMDRGDVPNTWQALYTRVSNRQLATENSIYETPVTFPGLYALWHMNNDAQDALGVYNGTVVGATFSRNAKFGSHSALFDHYARYIDVSGLEAWSNQFTISFWMKAHVIEAAGQSFILTFSSGSTWKITVRLGGSTSSGVAVPRCMSLYFALGGGGLISDTMPGTFNDFDDKLVWRHVALTYDRDAETPLTIYKDGQVLPLYTKGVSGNVPTFDSLRISVVQGFTTYNFQGQLDEIALFNRALDPGEIQNLFTVANPVTFQVRSGTESALTSEFIGPDGTTNSFYSTEVSILPSNTTFGLTDRYVQYQVQLNPSGDRMATPYVDAVAFVGSKGEWFDYALGDFAQGTFLTNTTAYPEEKLWSYVGLAKKPNGGYYDSGIFTSRILDGGAARVIWDTLSFTPGAQALSGELPGLLALYPMDGNWADASAVGRPEGIATDVSFTDPEALLAKFGTLSCVFNGRTSRVALGNFTGIKTVEFWINDENPDDGVIGFNSGSLPYLVVTNGYIQPLITGGGTLVYVNGSASSARLVGGWNHVVVTRTAPLNATAVTVGLAGTDYLDGVLDDMAFYDRDLPSAEIIEHYTRGQRHIAGRARFQARSADTIGELLLTPFVGPGGSVSNFYADPSGTVLAVLDKRYFQFQSSLEGNGNATPAFSSVTITYGTGGGTSARFVEDAGDELGAGTFVDGRTQFYGDQITPINVAAVGPFNIAGTEDPSLSGLWHMDEPIWRRGPTVRDSSGLARHGSPVGAAKTIFQPRVGQACGSFDGIGSYVSLTPVNDIGGGDCTVGLWFRTTSTRRSALISSYDGVRHFTLEINGDGTSNPVPGAVSFVVDDGSEGVQAVVAQRGLLNDDRWHHVAGVRARTVLFIYVDGERIGATSIGGFGRFDTSATLTLAKYGTLDVFFEGFLDEAFIARRAFSDGEIGELAGAGYEVNGEGVFTGPIMDGGQPVIWSTLGWGAHGPSGLPLGTNDASLAGLWHLDGDARDASARGNHGSVVGGSFVADSIFGQSLNLSGSGRVEVPDHDSLEPARLTVEAWIKPNAVDNRTILDKRDGTRGYALALDAEGRPYFWLSSVIALADVPLKQGEWAHVAGTYNGRTMRLYIDGVSRATAVPVGVTIGTSSPLKLGEGFAGGGFSGLIDEAAVHGRALVTEEVVDHYRAYATTLRFQIRAANTLPFVGPFIGPDGTTNTYFRTESSLRAVIPTAQYFQYRADVSSTDARLPAILRGVRTVVQSYPTLHPWVAPVEARGYSFPGRVLNFGDARTFNPGTDVKYQVSGDIGLGISNRWFYWDSTSSRWVVVDPFGVDEYDFQANTRDVVSLRIPGLFDQYYAKAGGVFRFKAFLHSGGDQPMAVDWVQVAASEGRVVIVFPNGQETNQNALVTGVPYDILWEHGGNVTAADKVTLEYTIDGGAKWNPVASGVTATDDRYPWTTPDFETEQARIRITHQTDPSIQDQSDGLFHIARRFHVDIPNGGEIWYMGETNTVVWDSPRGAASVNIDYSGTGAWSDPVEVIHFLSRPGGVRSNTYAWVTPSSNPALPSLTGKIRVQSPAGASGDESDLPFILGGAAVSAPVYNEKVRQGVVYPLAWNSALCGDSVRIQFQRFPGAPLEQVATNVPNADGANTWDWLVLSEPTFNGRLYISSETNARAWGTSPEFIVAAIRVIDPHGDPDPASTNSERWLMGTTNIIRWFSAGASDQVNLLYSTDSGATWKLIEDEVANPPGATNTYAWRVPTEPTARARVRVEDAEVPDELWATSPYDFHISGLSVVWPNGPVTQEWVKGKAESIRWASDEVGDQGLVELTYDGGVTWTNVVAGGGLATLRDGALPPYVATNPTVRGLVRITPTDPLYRDRWDQSDSFFTVAGLRIDHPRAGALYTIGTTNLIRFIAAGTHDPDGGVDIYYSGDGVTFDAKPIVPNLLFNEAFPGETLYDWVVEAIRRPSAASRIKIVAGAYEEISPPFTVRGIRFDAPASGAIWGAGLRTMRWSFAGISLDAVGEIWLSRDGRAGAFSRLIARDVLLRNAQQDWVIEERPDPSTNAVLRFTVTNTVDAGMTAFSEPFLLQGVSVTEPAAGAVWPLGSTNWIRWKAAAAGESVDLFYSADGGATYDPAPIRQVVASEDGSNSFAWAVEMTRMPSTSAVIRVITSGGLSNESARFRLEGIKVTRPTGRSVYSRTDPTNWINWAAVGDEGPYTLSYSREGGAFVDFGTAPVGSRSYNWASIPPAAVSSNVRVRVTGARYANESERFQIVAEATVFVVRPEPGAYWQMRKDYTVEWSRGGFMDPDFVVYYQLSTEGFVSNHFIAAMDKVTYDPEDNAYRTTWRTPDVPRAAPEDPVQARIVVQDLKPGSTIGDRSEPFYLVGQFQLWAPKGGEVFFALKPTPVSWLTIGRVPSVDLYFSATPPYLADSWTKINDAPITNEFNVDGTAKLTTYLWPVAKIPFTTRAKVRVQEAAYPGKFDEGVEGPYDSCDLPFTIRYYRIFWEVLDGRTGSRLDNLSVIDSSGWSTSGLSCVPPQTVSQDYPWGYWNTVWYRRYFHDLPVLGWNPDAGGGAIVWTQRVTMSRAEIEPDYRVLANFVYNFEDKRFNVQAWLERGGAILPAPQRCEITIYDAVGKVTADTSPNPNRTATLGSNGVFSAAISAAAMSVKAMYFAKVEIEYAGEIYSSGLIFTLQVPVGAADVAAIVGAAQAEIQNRLAGVSNEVAGVGELISGVEESLRVATNLLLGVSNIMATTFGTSTLVDVIGPLTTVATNIEFLTSDTSSGLARILTRPTSVERGTTNSILYKTRRGYGDSTVWIEVMETGVSNLMDELGNTGIYSGDFVADALGTFTLKCSDPVAWDSMIVEVLERGATKDIPAQLETITNKLNDIYLRLEGATNVEWSALAKVSESLATITNVEWGVLASMAESVNLMTNRLTLMNWADITSISNNVWELRKMVTNITVSLVLSNEVFMALTNTLNEVATNLTALKSEFTVALSSALTNVTRELGAVTGVLATVDWVALTNMSKDVSTITDSFARVDWRSLTNVSRDVGAITTAIQSVNWAALTNVAKDVGFITSAIHAVQWDALTNVAGSVATITNALGTMKWEDIVVMSSNMLVLTDQIRDVDWGGLTNVSRNLAAITNAIYAVQWGALTNIADSVDTITNALGALRWDDLTRMSTNMDRLSSSLTVVDWAAMTNLSKDVGLITGALSRVDWYSLTNVSKDVGLITNAIASVNWDSLTDVSRDVGVITSAIYAVQWDSLTNLSKSVGTITNALGTMKWDDITVMSTNMAALQAELRGVDWGGLTNVSGNLAAITNSIYSVQWDALTNLSKSVGTITNALGDMRWDDINAMSTNMLALQAELRGVDWAGLTNVSGNLAAITNSIYAVQWDALTNLSKNVATITNALGTMRWDDISTMSTNMRALEAGLRVVDWSGLTNIAKGVGVITTALAAVEWDALTNLSSSVAGVTGTLATVDWGAITNVSDDMRAITNALGAVQWGDVAAISQQVARLSDKFSGLTGASGSLNWGDIDGITRAVDELRAAIGDQDVGGVVSAILGTLEATLGRPTDRPGTGTVFGRLSGIEQSLGTASGQATVAAKKAQTARTAADSAAKGVQDLKREVGVGNIDAVTKAIEDIKTAVAEARRNILEIPSAIGPQAVYESMQDAARILQEFAASKGYEYLVKLEGVPGAVPEGAAMPDGATMGALNRNMQEMKDSIQFMQKLVDEMRYEPVITESLVGVP